MSCNHNNNNNNTDESVDVSVILDRIDKAQDQLFDHLRNSDDVIRQTFTQQQLLNYLRHQQLLNQLLSILSMTLPDFATLARLARSVGSRLWSIERAVARLGALPEPHEHSVHEQDEVHQLQLRLVNRLLDVVSPALPRETAQHAAATITLIAALCSDEPAVSATAATPRRVVVPAAHDASISDSAVADSTCDVVLCEQHARGDSLTAQLACGGDFASRPDAEPPRVRQRFTRIARVSACALPTRGSRVLPRGPGPPKIAA